MDIGQGLGNRTFYYDQAQMIATPSARWKGRAPDRVFATGTAARTDYDMVEPVFRAMLQTFRLT